MVGPRRGRRRARPRVRLNEELARAAYIRYAREVRAEGGEPSNYHRWLVEYGYDEDEVEEHTTVERKVVR
jgi:hypothetical protein